MSLYFAVPFGAAVLTAMYFAVDCNSRQRSNLPSGKQFLLFLLFAGIAAAIAFVGDKFHSGTWSL
jgi:hypothetical protein